MKRPSRRRAPAPRSCGDCRACCVVLGFEARPDEAAFTKPAGEPCPHLCAAGCGIYAERPPVCRRFQCAWLQEPSVPEAFRPDRCGVLFALNENLLGEGCAVFAYETEPGAADRPAVARWMQEVATRAPVLLVRADGRREVLTADPATGARAAGRRA